MSGFCGICEPGAELASRSLGAMLSALALPDDSEPESKAGRSVALGVSRRWPTQQVTRLNGIWVAMDGDLCNISALQQRVAGAGNASEPPGAATCVAQLYRSLGLGFLETLRGSFSVALWDEAEQRLILAIDRLGIKTLYWRREPHRLLFASRVGAIRAAQSGPAEVDPAAVVQYLLFSAVPAPLTIYRGVEKLRPGSYLVFENGRVHQQAYWDLDYRESEETDAADWACLVREGIRTAVHFHLHGCSPATTGAYLSGGTDSSSVVAFMSEHHRPVNTFSIAFSDPQYNEIDFARVAADRFGALHHEKRLQPEHVLEAIPKLARYYDEPFANSSAVGAYCCAEAAKAAGVEVLLAGDGGDELFAGNARYAYDKYLALYQAIPVWFRRGFIEPVASFLPMHDGWLSLPRRYIRRALLSNPQRILSYSIFLESEPESIFEESLLTAVPRRSWLKIAEQHFDSARAKDELNRLLYLDVKMTLADNDLRKVAGTAEIAGVRVRFPLLDHPLAELSARIPTGLKLKGFEKRYVFKRAMEGILPAKVLHKKKHGFGVPAGQWLLSDARLRSLLQDVLNDPRTRQRGFFRKDFFTRVWNLQQQEDAGFYGEALWYLLMLELWHREHGGRASGKV